MKVETIIHLNRFTPRDYQLPLMRALTEGKKKRLLCVWARRCLSGDTHILLLNGSWKLLKNIRVGDRVLSWNGSEFEADTVKNVWKTEIKPVKKIKAYCNLPIFTSNDHRFPVLDTSKQSVSWTPVSSIAPRKQILTFSGMKLGNKNNPDLAEFIGYITCDGYCVGHQQPKFTNTNKEILNRVALLSERLFGYIPIWRKKGNGYDLGFTNGTRGGGATKNKVKELFRKHGQDVQKSKMRLLPIVWRLDRESLLRFFAAVISSDGSIYCHKSGFFDPIRKRTAPPANEITISCGSSDNLCWDMYWLLRKLGISPQIPYKEKGSNWKIKIAKGHDIKALLSFGPIYGKEDAQKKILSRIPDDPYKQAVWNECLPRQIKIEDSAPQELYDIETEKNHNFVANGYVVHNSGKDVCAFNGMIRSALQKVAVYYYIFPTYAQAKKVIWNSITNTGERFLDYIPTGLISSKNSQEMKIELINGSIIQLVGSDNVDSLVGTNPAGVVFSEYALQSPLAYQFLRPILLANDGWSLFISTPRGKNHFWELYNIAKNNTENWFVSKLSVLDTGHISINAINREISEGLMSEDLSQQEYYVSFLLGVEGSYYAKSIDKMRVNGQIGMVPWEPSFKVHTAWDLGVRDMTSIIFFQVAGQVIRIIDCYEKNKEGLEHYVNIINSKPYTYGKHFAPHDIAVKEFGSGLTRIEKAKRLGISFIVADNIAVMDGIEAVRSTLPKVWIDEQRCIPLIKALENYRQEFDVKKKVYKPRPLHDVFSNFADAMRYLCLSLPKTRDGMTPEDLDRLHRESIYGSESNIPSFFRDDSTFY